MGRAEAEEAVAELQRVQLGLVTRSQAAGLGLSAKVVDGRVRRGRYRGLLPGVYGDAGLPDSWEVAALAAVLWAGGDAVLARDSAARLHGLPLPGNRGAAIHLLVRDRCFAPRDGIIVHRTRTLPDRHVTVLRPHPVTTATRAVCDLATTLATSPLRRLVAAAARDGLTDAARLRSCLRELGPVPGARALRLLVDELSPLDVQCSSEFESVYLRMAREHGVEPTAMNHPVRDAHGRRRHLDAVYLPEHVWVELDSRRFHGTLLDRNDDAIRTASIERAGEWADPLRFTWEDVTQRPAGVAGVLRRALTAAAVTTSAPPPRHLPRS